MKLMRFGETYVDIDDICFVEDRTAKTRLDLFLEKHPDKKSSDFVPRMTFFFKCGRELGLRGEEALAAIACLNNHLPEFATPAIDEGFPPDPQ